MAARIAGPLAKPTLPMPGLCRKRQCSSKKSTRAQSCAVFLQFGRPAGFWCSIRPGATWPDSLTKAIEFEGKEPSPRRLGAIVTQARAKGVKVIFVQPQMSRRTAETIAQAIGARVLVADPLAADWAANLRAVAAAFRAALR
jgi:hypothetical protein